MSDTHLDGDAIVANARALGPAIEAAADAIARDRRLPDDLIESMVPPDPAASRLTVEPATPRAVVESVLLTAPVSDDHPLPVLDAPHPRLARVLAWVVPWWAARRAAARVARHLHALWARVTAAHDARRCARDPEHLASPAGPAWRRSRYCKR
jgi:hypothetical protein